MKLHKSKILLKTYTDERVPVIGQLNVHVSYGSQKAALVLLVVAGAGPTLPGRNWLRHIRLDWKAIHAISDESSSSTALNQMLTQFEELFSGKLGTVKNYGASLDVHPDATPRFVRARPVPFAIKPAVEEELEKLEKSGVIEKVTYS